jgi:hypothetical protein
MDSVRGLENSERTIDPRRIREPDIDDAYQRIMTIARRAIIRDVFQTFAFRKSTPVLTLDRRVPRAFGERDQALTQGPLERR